MVLLSLVGLMLQCPKEARVRLNQVSNRTAYTLSKKCFNLDIPLRVLDIPLRSITMIENYKTVVTKTLLQVSIQYLNQC